MSSETDPEKDPKTAEASWRRRRRLDAVFGDDLPETVTDPGENPHAGRGRRWYDENRPPHHG
ncbi:hypothetical protein [Gordonia phthalatica]|uniref:Uncharacterized protein n=1 Tax=Gordonia phthalatica TaxID=1136941 RepID=A0A0N9N7B3_9ACTN|nr:hypothetical protein [Gordonia phthalatica]ALG83881.1 hypothetical protein ACH46_04335 [Gordonia phthalatica]